MVLVARGLAKRLRRSIGTRIPEGKVFKTEFFVISELEHFRHPESRTDPLRDGLPTIEVLQTSKIRNIKIGNKVSINILLKGFNYYSIITTFMGQFLLI